MTAKTPKQQKDEDRRICGMVSIAMPVDRITKPVFGKHGFVSGALIVDWASIVGSAVASHTLPVQIKFPPKERAQGTLVVKVASSAFATELQHLEPLVLERINGYFGWQAVSRLKLMHGPLPQRPAAKPPTPEPSPEAAKRLEQTLAGVEDDELRAVLERLGRQVAAGKG
ncbi:MAG TPA: DciA family protein [Candidatus Omnitrophota bacterium]|nr:DciA family protein [Candidatus Omnitrophota bacterium]